MRTRICDYKDCTNDASFKVSVYNEDSERIDFDQDVCGPAHARQTLEDWLKEMADIEEATV